MGWGSQGADMATPVDHGRGWFGGVEGEPSSNRPNLWLELAKIGPFEKDVTKETSPLPGSHAGSSRAKIVAERSRSEASDSGLEQRNNLDITIELARFGPVDEAGTDAGAENAEEIGPQDSCTECLPQVGGALAECSGKEECCHECGVKSVSYKPDDELSLEFCNTTKVVASFEMAVLGSPKKHPNADICAWAPSFEGSEEDCGLEMMSL